MKLQSDLLNIRLPHLLKFHLPKSTISSGWLETFALRAAKARSKPESAHPLLLWRLSNSGTVRGAKPEILI